MCVSDVRELTCGTGTRVPHEQTILRGKYEIQFKNRILAFESRSIIVCGHN
ncbi:hypothetical protein M5D96_008668 [Drosophila gunungcola]|uniref:Uncharacterized protein n=1 Tax=Drosophila gunungcola TaxID=103775 RepID=A0A9P9YL98_9MUSC|nr:hypothetical protein M5D96_008668 [Drosophila gunungcola]